MRTTPLDRLRNYRTRALAALRVPGAPLHVVSEMETLRTIRERRASIARYGDGELEIIIGGAIHFQEHDPELALRLLCILREPRSNFLIGIPNFDALQIKTEGRKGSWQRYRRMFSHLVRRGAEYHSAFVSRPASIIGLESAEYFETWQTVWAGREIVVVHHTAATAEHPIFRTASQVYFEFCPGKNAFRDYASVLERTAAHCSRPDVLFLIAAGPTAGVLAWDLAERGAQALDIGHLTAAYDEFVKRR